jgi:hypothetical protein
LAHPTQPDQPGRGFLLRAGQWLKQPFVLPAGVVLYRIDVQMGPLYRHLRGGPLQWTLHEISPAGRAAVSLSGRADVTQLIRDDCLSLRFPPLSLPVPGRFELLFSVPSDVPEAKSPEFLLFDGTPAAETSSVSVPAAAGPGQCLKGYLYLLPKHP